MALTENIKEIMELRAAFIASGDGKFSERFYNFVIVLGGGIMVIGSNLI